MLNLNWITNKARPEWTIFIWWWCDKSLIVKWMDACMHGWMKDETSGGASNKATPSDAGVEKESEKAKDYSSIYSTISAPALARWSFNDPLRSSQTLKRSCLGFNSIVNQLTGKCFGSDWANWEEHQFRKVLRLRPRHPPATTPPAPRRCAGSASRFTRCVKSLRRRPTLALITTAPTSSSSSRSKGQTPR